MVAPVAIDATFDLSCGGPQNNGRQKFQLELSVDLNQMRWCPRPGCDAGSVKVAGNVEILMVRSFMKSGVPVEQRITYNRGNGRVMQVISSAGKASVGAGLCVERDFTPLSRPAKDAPKR